VAEPLALYVHWPFCLAKCPYCDFNSHVSQQVEHQVWQEALLTELQYEAARVPDRELVSIFFGGGTPSLMQPDTVEAVIEAADALWPHEAVEVTLEANPTSMEAKKLRDFEKAGVNRVSMGIQSLRDEGLQFLGREHSVKEALQALEMAQGIFPRVSFDLIYARPQQSLEAWQAELEEALQYGTEHLSLYQLTIEPDTPFARWHRAKQFTMPEEDVAADLYEWTHARMESLGMPAYEISNYAKLGQESRHNLAYWRSEDYLGVGPGAHGRYWQGKRRIATQKTRAPQLWLTEVQKHGHATEEEEPIENESLVEEMVLMGLRMREGLRLSRLAPLIEWEGSSLHARAERLVEEGMLVMEPDALKVTDHGRLLLNAVVARLVT